MFSLVYTVYSQKQPLEVFLEISQNTREKHGRVSFLIKLQACKNTFFTEHLWTTASGVEKFHRKTSMVESLFNKVVDTYFEEHLPTPAFVLHLRHSFLISFTLYSAPSFSWSLLLLLLSLTFFFGSNSKGLKEFKSGISFSLKSLSLVLFYFFIFFFSVFLSFVLFFPVAAKKRLLLSWGLIKMFLPTLTLLKYDHVSK